MRKDKIDKIKQLETQIANITAGWQRTQADFLNYKKQTEESRVELLKSANANLIYELLPIMDNFKLASNHTPKESINNEWVQGINQIERQFEAILECEGLTKIDALDKQFDPQFHEAVEEIESDKTEGTIVTEILPGYMYGGSVLRPAKVKVAKNTL